MQDKPKTSNEEKAEFCKLLRQKLAKEITDNTFLSDPVLNRRLILICQSVTKNKADADEITNTVRLKISEKIAKFKPDYEKPYGNFFAWVRTIARRLVIDGSRHKTIQYVYESTEDVRYLHDKTIDVAEEFDRQAAIRRFEAMAEKSDAQTQAIMKYYRQGYSLREITQLGDSEIQCSHVTVRKRVSDFLAEFFIEEDKLLATNVDRKDDQPSGPREKKSDQTSGLQAESGAPPAQRTGS